MAKILVVDDAAADRVLVSRLLKRDDVHLVVEAIDGSDAIQKLESESYDLVLTDLQMPGMDGLELVSEVRKRFPLIPTVLMTAAGSELIAVKALQAGASSYVPKSNIITELLSTIESVQSAAATTRAHQEIRQRILSSNTHIRIETEHTLVMSLLRFLREVIHSVKGLPPSEHVRLGVALEEAVLNAYYHGNLEVSSTLRESGVDEFSRVAAGRCAQSPYCDRCIDIEIHQTVEEISFCIRDEGPGFDVAGLPDPTAPEFLARPHGRGIMLMRTFLEEVRFNERGNEVTLVKRLGAEGSV